jgi:hypothetical protein
MNDQHYATNRVLISLLNHSSALCFLAFCDDQTNKSSERFVSHSFVSLFRWWTTAHVLFHFLTAICMFQCDRAQLRKSSSKNEARLFRS